MKNFSLLLCLFLINLTPVHSQIGKFLKDKAKQAVQNPELRNLAKDVFVSELEKARDEYDTTSFNYAIALSDNAGLFENKERFERQQKFLLDYMERKEGNISETDRAKSWVDKSEMLYANGKYKLANGMLLSAKTVYEVENEVNSIDYARTIANLSLVSHSLGKLRQAEEYGVTALDLRSKILGTQSRGYAAGINNMALIKKDLGYYNEAENMLNEALTLNMQILGKNSMAYAICLNNLASLHQVMGRYEQAEPLFDQSIQIADKHLREKSGDFQRLQTNLALLYQDMGKYEEAESIYLEAISIKKKRFGENHPDYAHLLNNLASLYVLMEKYDDVEKLLKKSITIYESKQGEDSPATAASKNDLGNFYLFRGEHKKAVSLLKESYEIRVKSLGADHPLSIQSKEDLAIGYWQNNKFAQSYQLYKEVLESTYETIDKYFLPMSENEKSKFWAKLRPRLHRFYNFAYSNHEKEQQLLVDLFELQINTKALLLSSTNKIRNEILASENRELKDKYDQWIDQKELLSHYYTYSKEELADENINLDSLESEANQTERYLSQNSNAFQEGVNAGHYHYEDVVNSINHEEALVEIIQSKIYKNSLTDQSRYLALIIKTGQNTPQLVSLENGDQLNTRYFKYYSNVIHNKMDDTYSYDQYWKAVDNELQGYKKVFISPDGVYNQINVNTLTTGTDKFVIDQYSIARINNPGDVVNINKPDKKSLKAAATLIGFPEYGGNGEISPLPGTKVEINKINTILKRKKYQSQIYMGSDASETTIKNLHPEGILHIATHGFFLQPVKEHQQSVFGINTEKANENPLLRSGLMLTGAGLTVDSNITADFSGSDNGILTSYEAMNLPLQNTKLVVLSACETAVGDVQSGEGVYGLQRAFQVAGSKNIIMSLWKVDDEATQELMTFFYSQLMSGKSIDTAFRNAQIYLRQKYKHPYYWGAFVLNMS